MSALPIQVSLRIHIRTCHKESLIRAEVIGFLNSFTSLPKFPIQLEGLWKEVKEGQTSHKKQWGWGFLKYDAKENEASPFIGPV